MVENWAESATTQNPHTTATTNTRAIGPERSSPIVSAQEPEMAMARVVDFVRPHRSPSRPPTQQPTAPAPMTTKVASAAPVRTLSSPPSARVSAKNAANQAHMAYSSHMWPK